jgi:glutaredoxin
MSNNHPIIQKILGAGNNTFVIFFVHECPYCRNALTLLQNSGAHFKAYNINNINGGMGKLLSVLNQNANMIGFNRNHQTKPLIFLNGKFIGGFSNLQQMLGNQQMSN